MIFAGRKVAVVKLSVQGAVGVDLDELLENDLLWTEADDAVDFTEEPLLDFSRRL